VDSSRRRDERVTNPFYGAVAQLGERRVRNAKVGGSSPLGSTIFREDLFTAKRRVPPEVLAVMFWALGTTGSAERLMYETRQRPNQQSSVDAEMSVVLRRAEESERQ
jgi:hypothetical protein